MMRRQRKQFEERLARRAVAAEWMEALQSGELHDHAKFDEWLRESKLNVETYLELEALDRQIHALDAIDRPDIESISAQAHPDVLSLRVNALRSKHPRLSERRAFKWMAIAAGIVSIAMLGPFVYRSLSSPDNRSFRTSSGEQRTLALSDGSVVRMNVETQLKIEYGPHRRDIRLASGEAMFKVAQDATRPFIVHTPSASVRALGTQFNVYQRQSTVVSVIEGKVQLSTVSRESTVSPQLAQRLSAGEEAQVARGEIRKLAHPDVTKSIAWRHGQVYFDNALLEDIVSEFNRHGGTVSLKLEGISPGTYRFGGTFNVEEPQSLADVLEDQREFEVERRDGVIVIRPKARPNE